MKKETLIAVLIPAIIILLVAFIAIFFYRKYLKHKYALYLAPDKDFVVSSTMNVLFYFVSCSVI